MATPTLLRAFSRRERGSSAGRRLSDNANRSCQSHLEVGASRSPGYSQKAGQRIRDRPIIEPQPCGPQITNDLGCRTDLAGPGTSNNEAERSRQTDAERASGLTGCPTLASVIRGDELTTRMSATARHLGILHQFVCCLLERRYAIAAECINELSPR